ncbi:alpha/beta hydrolase [Fictibacillus sp. UD]|uniref:alpha/beta fold hydrolase n=1 Tax=Fictibacillus sp. UD TaxID=3038777 RepID=UPI003746A920
MPYCKVEKANMYYEEIGSGTPIIIIHGFTLDHRAMKGCMEPVFQEREGYKRIYIDLPGMGQTKDYDDVANTDDMLETVIECIDALLPNQSFLIAGYSYGGYLTRGVIARMGERVLGAAFICPVIIAEKGKRTLPEHKVIHRDETFLATLNAEEKEFFENNFVVLNENTWNRAMDELVVGMEAADQSFLERIQNAYGYSFEVDEGNLANPSLFIVGRQDNVVGYKNAFDILYKYPRAAFSIVDTAGHNLQIEQGELFNVHFGEWLVRTMKVV